MRNPVSRKAFPPEICLPVSDLVKNEALINPKLTQLAL
jgi:hypothetical protein